MIFLALLAGAGAVCYFVWDGYFRDKSGDAVEDLDAANVVTVTTQTTEKAQGDETEVVEKEKVIQYDGEDPNLAEGLTGAITYAGVSGDVLMIRVNIDQYLAGGSCVLSVAEFGEVIYTDTAEIVDSAATATCEGFNVPVAAIGEGEFVITVNLESGGKTGVISGGASV